ncbi:TauD/TfdA family dioxygenase [soil metagenome]
MAFHSIKVRKLTPAIGAEISGVDLSKPLGNQVFQEIHDALMANMVIFFRGQELTHEQHKEFGRRFGALHIHPTSTNTAKEHPEILTIKADERSKYVAGEEWHSDVSCDAEPPMGSILYMKELPPDGGGDTLFASMYRAYETLSAPIQRLCEGLVAVHDGAQVFGGRFGLAPKAGGFPRSEHPVVRSHPVTGRKALYVNRNFTTHLVGLGKAESAALLEMLYRHSETPEFQCRFAWQPNSIAFWDNRAAMHHAMWDYFPHRRLGYRVTVKGDKPFYRA